MINQTQPAHYARLKHQPYDVIDDWGLNFSLGNAIKYIARHQHKGEPLQDLKKARAYLDRQIQRMETEEARPDNNKFPSAT